MTTMNSLYGDGSDHPACPICEQCIKCNDCKCTVESLRAQLTTLQAKLEAAEKDAASKQAEIDRLMLEFCPGEMSQEQFENYERHQRAIDAALAQNGKE